MNFLISHGVAAMPRYTACAPSWVTTNIDYSRATCSTCFLIFDYLSTACIRLKLHSYVMKALPGKLLHTHEIHAYVSNASYHLSMPNLIGLALCT